MPTEVPPPKPPNPTPQKPLDYCPRCIEGGKEVRLRLELISRNYHDPEDSRGVGEESFDAMVCPQCDEALTLDYEPF